MSPAHRRDAWAYLDTAAWGSRPHYALLALDDDPMLWAVSLTSRAGPLQHEVCRLDGHRAFHELTVQCSRSRPSWFWLAAQAPLDALRTARISTVTADPSR